MEIQEAIKILHPDTTAEALEEYDKEESIKMVEEACIVACEALEKQIPYKVVNRGDEHEKYGYCKCGAFEVDIHECCTKCGQAIDW